MKDLIDMANDIDSFVRNNEHMEEYLTKEFKKYEMYMRKAYIMSRGFQNMLEDGDIEGCVRGINAALIRDQRYVKQRDSMEAYEI